MQSIKHQGLPIVFLGSIILLSTAFMAWDLIYVHSFWISIIGADLIVFCMVPFYRRLKHRPDSISEWNQMVYLAVFFLTITGIGLKLRNTWLANNYAAIKVLEHLPHWLLALIICIVFWGIKRIILKWLESHSQLQQMDTRVYADLSFMILLVCDLLVFGLFYIWLMSLYAILLLGFFIMIRLQLRNLAYLKELAVNIADNRFRLGPQPSAAYLPQPLIHEESSENEFVQDLATLDHPVKDFEYIITCAPYKVLQKFMSSPTNYHALLWNLDLLIIDQAEIVDTADKALYISFAEQVVRSVDSPRTCILSVQRSKSLENSGLIEGGLVFSGSSLENTIIPKITCLEAPYAEDEVRRYLIESFEPVYLLNKRLFSFLSDDQFAGLDWIISQDIAPVSGLMLRMLRTASVTERYLILLNFCEAKVRFLAALALSIARQNNPKLYDELKDDVFLAPSFGKWVNAIRVFNHRFRVVAEDGSQDIVDLLDKWCQPLEKSASVQAALNNIAEVIQVDQLNKQKIRAIDFYGSIVSLRNKTVGHGMVTFNVAESLTNAIVAAIVDIENATCRNWDGSLLWRSAGEVFSYNGAASVLFHKLAPLDESLEEASLYYRYKSFKVCLHPWLYRDPDQSRLMFFNGSKSKRTEYLSYESGNIIEPAVELFDGNPEMISD